MMHHTKNSQDSCLLEDPQIQRGASNPDGVQVPLSKADEEETTAFTSKGVSAGGTPSIPKSPQRASSPPMIMGSIPEGPSDEASGYQVEELEDPVSFLHNALNIKVSNLVQFLLFKYEMKELTTLTEILDIVIRDYEEYFFVIFTEASECLKLVFGIDVMEVDQVVHSYVLVTTLGITYDGMMHGVQGKPKTGLLIVILGIIFMEGNCVSEEAVWRMLNTVDVYAGNDHFLYGEPRKLITEHFVDEGYLEYRQMPGSDPVCYEFMWGPRAHAETTKMKVLEFFASITRRDPRLYPAKYEEALREEEERGQA